jgi:hypothetical protein
LEGLKPSSSIITEMASAAITSFIQWCRLCTAPVGLAAEIQPCYPGVGLLPSEQGEAVVSISQRLLLIHSPALFLFKVTRAHEF